MEDSKYFFNNKELSISFADVFGADNNVSSIRRSNGNTFLGIRRNGPNETLNSIFRIPEAIPQKWKRMSIAPAEDLFIANVKPLSQMQISSAANYEVSGNKRAEENQQQPRNPQMNLEELKEKGEKAAKMDVRIKTLFSADNFKNLENLKKKKMKWRKKNSVVLKSDEVKTMKEEIKKIIEAKDEYYANLKNPDNFKEEDEIEKQGLMKNIEILKDVLLAEELISRGEEGLALKVWNKIPNRLAGLVVEGYELERIWESSSWLKTMTELRVDIQLATSILNTLKKRDSEKGMSKRDGLNLQMWMDLHEDLKKWDCVKKSNALPEEKNNEN